MKSLDITRNFKAIDGDPTLRNLVMHRFAACDGTTQRLFSSISSTNDPEIRRLLILAIGESTNEAAIRDATDPMVIEIERLLQTDPDSGVHSACEWVLRRWGFEKKIAKLRKVLSTNTVTKDRNWHINQLGQTFAVFHAPLTAQMTLTPQQPGQRPDRRTHEVKISQSFMIATHEVSMGTFAQFMGDAGVLNWQTAARCIRVS